jgi:HNH endonuclease
MSQTPSPDASTALLQPRSELILQECVIWTGRKDRNGYPESAYGRKIRQRIFGIIPDGLEVDHLCCNPSCINPNHLELVTGKENHRRRKLRKTHCSKGHPKIFWNVFIHADGKMTCGQCYKDKALGYVRLKSRRRARIRGVLERLWAEKQANHAGRSA